MVKLGFTGVTIIFLISAQNIDCGNSLELPGLGGSRRFQRVPTFYISNRNMKNLSFLSDFFF